jgi:N utilization substance protein A
MVVSELRGEKIDIIPYNDEPARFVAKALSPARVREVLVDDDGRQATVIVPDDQLSLAIGREGQNARLAARLTGWRIDIRSETDFAQDTGDDEFQEESNDGRCHAVLGNGRRCPNASLGGSYFCGLVSHQALRRFPTNEIGVISALTEDELALLASDDAPEDAVAALVARGVEAFEQAPDPDAAGPDALAADEAEPVEGGLADEALALEAVAADEADDAAAAEAAAAEEPAS